MSTTSALDSTYSNAISNALTSSTGSSEMGRESFLMLLVTQLQYQDPLNPMEDTEFVAQLAQFNSLEQAMTTNENLESLITLQGQQITIGAANYIGREVAARGYSVGVTNGTPSKIEFAAGENIAYGYANILNGTSVVATVELGSLAAGSIGVVEWDGTLSTGAQAADGVYSVSIVAYNADGQQISTDTQVTGRVTAVSSYDGEYYLRLEDGRTVTLANVREIVESSNTSASTTIKVQDGDASTVNFTLSEAISNGTASISNSSGAVVASVDLGKRSSGTSSFTWDAEDSDGNTVPDGTYTVTLSGRNAKGDNVGISLA